MHPNLRCATLATLALAVPAVGSDAPDKSGFHLLNPTPRELWRAMAADRPDATESPITVDAGAVQLEASFAELAIDDEDGATTTALSVAPLNLKVGLTNRIDLQLLLNPFERVDRDGGDDATGIGDFGVRVKINLWGNDEGSTALGLIPYVVFPTGDSAVTDDAYRFGLVVPFAAELGAGWSLGTQAELAFASPDDGRETGALAHTVALGRGIVGNLAGYVEYIGEYEFRGDPEYRPTASAGLTYELAPDTVLDAGLRAGLDNADTTDLVLFAGVTKRF